jgi:hypothetical protein
MKCLHCLVEFHPSVTEYELGNDSEHGYYILEEYTCPSCGRFNLYIKRNHANLAMRFHIPVYPKGFNRPPCPPEVPQDIAEDYREACLVLIDSPKASAALSRRCVQNILRSVGGVKPSDLYHEIQEVINNNKVPSHISDSLDAVRNIGNFAAHPLKSQTTGNIVDVEPEEAEWNLDVIDALIDFYYVQPAKVAAKKSALNNKLTEIGKPTI